MSSCHITSILSSTTPTLDLHGFTVADAVVLVGEVLERWSRSGELVIITGIGNNSLGGPRLKPVVSKMVAEWAGGSMRVVWHGGSVRVGRC